MILPVGIQITAFAAGALSTIGGLQQRLQSLGATATQSAVGGLTKFQRVGQDATSSLTSGFADAEAAWYKLGGALGVPMTLSGIWGAVSGVRTLKSAIIDSNAAMETARVNMSARLRDYNDTKATAELKARGVMKDIQAYAAATPFTTQGLTQAAVSVSSFTKDPGTVMDALKVVGRVAAMHGDTDPSHAGQAFEAAMNGNFTSLDQTFGIKANQDIINTVASSMGYNGSTMRGRYEALKRLIEMRTGGKDADPVGDLARTGPGAWSTLQDNFGIAMQSMSEKGYDAGVKGLVGFNDQLMAFMKTPGYQRFFAFMEGKFIQAGEAFAQVLGTIGDGLERLPGIVEKYTPMLTKIATVGAAIGAVNIAVLASKFAVGGSVLMLRNALGLLTPAITLLTNPALLLTIGALGAAMWPFAKGLEVGGKSLEGWVKNAKEWANGDGALTFFNRMMEAVQKLVSGDFLKGQRFNLQGFLTEAFGADSLPAQLGDIGAGMVRAFSQSLAAHFPAVSANLTQVGAVLTVARTRLYDFAVNLRNEVIPSIQAFAAQATPRLQTLRDTLVPLLPVLAGVAGAAGGLLLLGRAMTALAPIGTALGALVGVATPALTFLLARFAALRAVLGPAALSFLATAGAGFRALGVTISGLGAVGGVLGTVSTAIGTALPLLAGLAAPALTLGVLLLGSAFYDMGKNVEIGGRSIDGWLERLGKLSADINWSGIFDKPLLALRKFLNVGLSIGGIGGKFDAYAFWQSLFAPSSLFSRLKDLIEPIWRGIMKSLDNAFPELRGWFSTHLGGLVDDFENVARVITGIVIPAVTGFAQGLGVVVKMIASSGLGQFIGALATIAWEGMRTAFEALAQVIGHSETQQLISTLGKWIGVTAAALVTLKGVGTAVGAAGALAGAGGISRAGAIGLTVATVVMTAGAVSLYTKKIEDNVRSTGLAILTSATGGKNEGAGYLSSFTAMEQKTKITQETEAQITGSVLGAFGAIIGRGTGVAELFGKNVDAKQRGEYDASARVGVNMLNDGMGRIQALQLTGEDVVRRDRMKVVQDKLTSLYEAFKKTGQLDEKNVARLTDEYMRGMFYFNNEYGLDLLPKNLKDGFNWDMNAFTKWLGTGVNGQPGLFQQITGRIENPMHGTSFTYNPQGTTSPAAPPPAPKPFVPTGPRGGPGGGRNVGSGGLLDGGGADSDAQYDSHGVEVMPGYSGGGDTNVTLHVNVPVTIYANQMESMSQDVLAGVISSQLSAELPRQLANALDGVRT